MRVLESCLYAEDLVAAYQFYVGLLGLEEVTFDADRHLFMRLDGSMLILFRASKTQIPDAGVPPHGTVGAGHLAFRASEEELDEWEARLTAGGIEIIERITWGNGAKSIYFKDPAGNVLEFANPELWDMA